MLLGLAGFVGAAYLVERIAGLSSAVVLPPLAAIAMSALPALLWLSYFYSQDRHEPEPKHYVFGVYLLGAFVAGPAANFLVGQVTTEQTAAAPMLSAMSLQAVLMAFLVKGLAQELSKYAVVRYTIYLSPEFDEPMDGVIYMTAVGVGFATYENYLYLQGHEGEVFLSIGAAHVVVTTLAHACFAGVLGYALGRAKFASMTAALRSLTLFVGLLCATGLSGAFQLIRDMLVASGMSVTPWRVVAFAFGFAALVFVILSVMMRQLLAISPHRDPAPSGALGE
jgi:RsiW-degrading membrane proteinase PrsW (M82 family)